MTLCFPKNINPLSLCFCNWRFLIRNVFLGCLFGCQGWRHVGSGLLTTGDTFAAFYSSFTGLMDRRPPRDQQADRTMHGIPVYWVK